MSSERPPSVDRLARSLYSSGLPHRMCVEVARQAIAEDRVGEAPAMARVRSRQMLVPVINATGTLLHTNLGRAPVHLDSRAGYANVELDLETGERGSRQAAIGTSAALACGADAAMVVNNCASALLLVLAALARGRGAAVSRGELVEIGGAFRVPDVMRQSGAQLVEVGTTNRTRIDDFGRALSAADIALVLSVHQSNYKITGFSEQTTISELATLGVPVVADIGSGLLDAACPWLDGPPPRWLQDEPAARQTLAAGADLVIFSGDKLLGGPQAGIIAGRADLVAACSKHPLARALRPGGLVIEALQQTLLSYLRLDGAAIPFWRMADRPVAELIERAETMVDAIGSEMVEMQSTEAVPGGGTLPGRTIPSAGVRCAVNVAAALRNRDVPVVARIQDNATICDLRTVDPAEDEDVTAALREAIGSLR